MNFKAPFTFGKKKLERHRDLLVQMLHRLYTCRGQTRLLVADFEGARADYNSMMQLSLAGWTNSFFYHCIEEIDLEAVQPGTLAICKDLMQTGFTRRNLSTFVSALDRKLSNKSSYTMLPTVADKFYFLACYSFRYQRPRLCFLHLLQEAATLPSSQQRRHLRQLLRCVTNERRGSPKSSASLL